MVQKTTYLRSDRQLADIQKNFLNNIQSHKTCSKLNFKVVPKNATIREEHIKCGKPVLSCMCPYYYAYWKADNGKLSKKYIGTWYDEYWKKP